jgi:DNA-binding NtrC family response regulator
MTKILLVDDEPALLESMRSYLTRLGHSVVAFSGASPAWECFDADPAAFSLIIVDMTLGGMPGAELIQKILERNPDAAVLATSGYPGSLRNLGGPSGAHIVMLEKPFTPRMLTDALQSLLGGKPESTS